MVENSVVTAEFLAEIKDMVREAVRKAIDSAIREVDARRAPPPPLH
jgi:hypothetical protein